MLSQSQLARPSALRDSFIGISNYVRRQLLLDHTQPAGRRFASGPALRRNAQVYPRHRQKHSPASKLGFPRCKSCKTSNQEALSPAQHRTLTRFERSSLPAHDTLTQWPSILSKNPDKDVPEALEVKLCGYLTSQRGVRGADFLQLVDPDSELAIQVVVPTPTPFDVNQGDDSIAGESEKDSDSAGRVNQLGAVKNIKAHAPILVTGRLVRRPVPHKKTASTATSKSISKGTDTGSIDVAFAKHESIKSAFDPYVGRLGIISHLEIQATAIYTLNEFPGDIIATADTAFPPEQRHLQFRTDQGLRERIRIRSRVATHCRQWLSDSAFVEVETPLLFKSTPEGAREFLVPTRQKGMAYALPQSPQQYKQVLMASGIARYFQFARCFRDEDLRADRQPEFTQLDLEMSFANSRDIMNTVETLLRTIWQLLPGLDDLNSGLKLNGCGGAALPTLTYDDVMSRYGSDKPDVRLGSEIEQISRWLPPHVVGMLSSLDDPIVEMFKVDMQDADPSNSAKFIHGFLDSPNALPYTNNPAGMPGVAVYDPRKPLRGLASFEHDGAQSIEEHFDPRPGDILVAQTRANARFVGGSTPLGNLRRDIYAAAVQQGLIPAPTGFAALWVVDFPLFSPIEESAPGQGGSAGICSTHHPFTAPAPGQDLSKLLTAPLDVTGDHYDLVINGMEIGGGSRRIHTADLQEMIFRDVLQMKHDRIEDFRHLLNALASGCPPHAGFALGFDRLMTLITDRQSVRDVIAFPKSADGEDKFVGSPSLLTRDQLATYHLQMAEANPDATSPPISVKA